MTSADSCRLSRSSRSGFSSRCSSCPLSKPGGRPPRVRALSFTPCIRRIYLPDLRAQGLRFGLQAHPLPAGLMQFVSLGSVLCLRLPSDSASRRTPLPLANGYCALRRSGLSPYRQRPCRAHKQSPESLGLSGQEGATRHFFFPYDDTTRQKFNSRRNVPSGRTPAEWTRRREHPDRSGGTRSFATGLPRYGHPGGARRASL